MAAASSMTGQNESRAMHLVALGSSLRSEAAELVEDINECYGLVHDVLAEALSAPIGTPIDVEAMRSKLQQSARRARTLR